MFNLRAYLVLLMLSAGSAAAFSADLEALAFMQGHWISPENNDAEEVWLAPHEGTMTGSFRWAIPNGPHVLEYLVIQQTGKEIILRFMHFRPDYTRWEQVPNTYRLGEVSENRAVFVRIGDNDKVPERMIYSASDSSHLSFRGESGEGSDKKEPLILEFVRQPF
jgi:hypothetical protein